MPKSRLILTADQEVLQEFRALAEQLNTACGSKEELIETVLDKIPADGADAYLPIPLLEKLSVNDEDRVKQIVRTLLNSKEGKEIFLKFSKAVLTQLFKTLYVRRSFWRDSLNVNPD